MDDSCFNCKCGSSKTLAYYIWMTNCNCSHYYVTNYNNKLDFNYLMIRLSNNKILLILRKNNKLEISVGNFKEYFQTIHSTSHVMENNFSSMEDLINYFTKYSENLEFM